MKMVVDPKFSKLETLLLLRGQRFELQYCLDGLARTVYTPINSYHRDCRDCSFLDVGPRNKDNPELYAWCVKNRLGSEPDELVEDFSKAQTCSRFYLLGVTAEFSKIGEHGVEKTVSEFCKSWRGSLDK